MTFTLTLTRDEVKRVINADIKRIIDADVLFLRERIVDHLLAQPEFADEPTQTPYGALVDKFNGYLKQAPFERLSKPSATDKIWLIKALREYARYHGPFFVDAGLTESNDTVPGLMKSKEFIDANYAVFDQTVRKAKSIPF